MVISLSIGPSRGPHTQQQQQQPRMAMAVGSPDNNSSLAEVEFHHYPSQHPFQANSPNGGANSPNGGAGLPWLMNAKTSYQGPKNASSGLGGNYRATVALVTSGQQAGQNGGKIQNNGGKFQNGDFRPHSSAYSQPRGNQHQFPGSLNF